MKNTIKRMLSGLMAMSMLMCGATSVYAAELGDTSPDTAGGEPAAELEVDAITNAGTEKDLPTIDVTVPTSIGNIVINPFNLEGSGQIYSADIKVINNSVVPLSVTFAAASVSSESATISAKAPGATGDKSVMVNLSYTDGLGKTTSKVLSGEGQDVPVATPMAPLGGSVTYTFTGSTTINPTNGPWSAEDAITVTHAFKFVANTYAEYNITKSFALYTYDANKEFTEGDTLPSSILGDGKEFPVVWKNGETEYTTATDLTADTEYTACIPDANVAIYTTTIADKLPKITVKAAPSGD